VSVRVVLPHTPPGRSPLNTTASLPAATPTLALRDLILRKLTYTLGKPPSEARDRDWFMATALAVRDAVVERFLVQMQESRGQEGKHVYYLSLEFLIGRLLRENVGNLGLAGELRDALAELGVTTDQARLAEPDAALGNGGLGASRPVTSRAMSSTRRPGASATASATITGCSSSLHRWLDSRNSRGLAVLRQSLGVRPTRERLQASASAATVAAKRCPTATNVLWAPERPSIAVAYDTPVVGWRGAREHFAALARKRDASPVARCLQSRRPSGRGCRERNRARSDLEGALPNDRQPGRARSCACDRSSSSPRPRFRIWCDGRSSGRKR
jgi:starch phosphorylase